MCISSAGQILYGIVMLICFILTAVSLFTPGWTEIQNEGARNIYRKSEGIMPWTCAQNFKGQSCEDWWKTTPSWQHVVVICMWIALFLEALCFVWNILALCSCCLKRCLIHPLIPVTVLLTITLIIAIAVYGIKGKEFVIYSQPVIELPGKLGYSFILACFATGLAAIDTVLAFIIVCCARICC